MTTATIIIRNETDTYGTYHEVEYHVPPVSPIRRNGDGFFWTVDTEHGTVAYRTDSQGCGLWLDEGRGSLDRQVSGHAQWGLAGVGYSARRRRVQLEMARRHGSVDY